MLNVAREVEEAAAIASANPVAIAAASAQVLSAQQAYQQAREAYEMAKQAVNLAEIMKSKLEINCMKCLTQMQGHVQCDASWTICTRDVSDLEIGKQQELRTAIREAGSPIIGVLPHKDELDAACINFVFGDSKHD